MATLKTDIKEEIENILTSSKKNVLEFAKEVTFFDRGFSIRAKRYKTEQQNAEIIARFYCIAERYLRLEFSQAFKQFYLSIGEEQRSRLDAQPRQKAGTEKEQFFMEECFKAIRDSMEQEIAAERAFTRCHQLLPVFLCNRSRAVLNSSLLHSKETPRPDCTEVREYWLKHTSKSLIEILSSFSWREGCSFFKPLINEMVQYCAPVDLNLSVPKSLMLSRTFIANIKNTELELHQKHHGKRDLATLPEKSIQAFPVSPHSPHSPHSHSPSFTTEEESDPAVDKDSLTFEQDSAAAIDMSDADFEEWEEWNEVLENPKRAKLW